MEKDDLLFEENENNLRPQTLEEYIGQHDMKETLNIFIQTAKMRKECLDHV